jgi:hypothetical protein
MDKDEVEYFKHRLNEAIEGKGFYPAELCERKMKDKNVTLCCFVEE